MNLKCAKLQLLRLVSALQILLFSGWIPYKISNDALGEETAHHCLYDIVPRHRCQIEWYDLPHWIMWGLFGNDDDGLFGEGPHAHYRSEEPPSFTKALCWQTRNPLHNFCFYVIGSANRENSEYTLIEITPCHFRLCAYDPIAKTVFPSKNSCFYLGLHGCKPFISIRLRWTEKKSTDFYCGWRERGNFGLKFVPLKKHEK